MGEVRRIIKADGKFAIVKDQGVFGANKAAKVLKGKLEAAGFEIESTKQISKDDVEFYLVVSQLEE